MKSSELPALKLVILIFAGSLLFSYFRIDLITILAISLLGLISGLLLIKYKFKSSAYVILALSASIIISQRFDNHKIIFPDKIIPKQNAIFKGKVHQLLKSDSKYLRYVVKGTLDCSELPPIEDTKCLLTVISPKFALLPGERFIANIELNFPEANLPSTTFNFTDYLKSNEIQWSAITYGKNISIMANKNNQIELSYNLRVSIKKRIFSVFDSTSAGLMTALLTGDKSLVNENTRRNFSLSGTAHLLAVSGLHVGIISFLIYTLLAFVNNQKLKTIFTIVLLVAYVYILGWLDSALRATIMISVYLISTNFEKKVNPLNSLSIAALIMFLINPDVIYSISFRMSILSVAGVVLFYEKFRKMLSENKNNSKIKSFIINSVSVSMASSILISPLVAYYFGVYSIISPISNLLVVPIVLLALSFGITALIFSLLSFQIASYYSVVTELLLKFADKINAISISFDFSYIEGSESIIIAIMVSLLIFYTVIASTKRLMYFRVAISILIITFISINLPYFKDNQKLFIVPRENLTAVIVKNDTNCYVMMFDRMPQNSIKPDFGIKNYILDNEQNVIAAYSGNSGIATIDAVKKDKELISFEINNDIQLKIVNLLNLKSHPVKTINI